MKLQSATAFCGVFSMAQGMRIFTDSQIAHIGEVIPSEFTLRDGRSGHVYRQNTPCCVSPIPGWPGLDSSWTPSDEAVSYCDLSQAFGREDDYIGLGTVEDCTTLRDYMLETDGAFLLGPDGLLPGYYTGLIGHNTCVVSVGLDIAAPFDGLWVGNKDVADVLTLALENYVKDDGMLFTEGYWPCTGPSGSGIPATWNVW
ncbi:hypothetical protein UCREL1_6325 [Eutypa lata UCREL1]|uniref:Ecp2 effector protein-like domain-containing protein n=1 Tax=Eutypa lata (strain UCR-EL1) TaxID=1287681 RepID=M7TA16_EUTLA|nr:hypothetical protein UCREL1_6325 [Eutypa lata UCREL1]